MDPVVMIMLQKVNKQVGRILSSINPSACIKRHANNAIFWIMSFQYLRVLKATVLRVRVVPLDRWKVSNLSCTVKMQQVNHLIIQLFCN